MADASPLTLTFLEKRPAAAARTLAALPYEDAAAFLNAVPTRIAATMLQKLGAWKSASLVVEMDAERAGAALRDMGYTEAAATLRLVAPERRPEILAHLPQRLRRDFETSLSFPEDTVGAHMTTAIFAGTGDTTVGDTREEIARAPKALADMIFVVDESRRLQGIVTAGALLQTAPSQPIGTLLQADVPALSARARLSTIADDDLWADYTALPVIGRHKQVIGALARSVLQARPAGTAASDKDRLALTPVAALMGAFLASAVALTQILTESGTERGVTGERES